MLFVITFSFTMLEVSRFFFLQVEIDDVGYTNLRVTKKNLVKTICFGHG